MNQDYSTKKLHTSSSLEKEGMQAMQQGKSNEDLAWVLGPGRGSSMAVGIHVSKGSEGSSKSPKGH